MDATWENDAACRTATVDEQVTFFADDAVTQLQAIAICTQRCTVRAACLAAAYLDDTVPAYNVRGGLSGAQRTEARRARDKQAA